VGTVSVTVMLAAVLGPALTTTRAKLIVPLAVLPLGWLAVLLIAQVRYRVDAHAAWC
jgi:hypothetical protein